MKLTSQTMSDGGSEMSAGVSARASVRSMLTMRGSPR
jgi:hypothetical protein